MRRTPLKIARLGLGAGELHSAAPATPLTTTNSPRGQRHPDTLATAEPASPLDSRLYSRRTRPTTRPQNLHRAHRQPSHTDSHSTAGSLLTKSDRLTAITLHTLDLEIRLTFNNLVSRTSTVTPLTESVSIFIQKLSCVASVDLP